MVLWLNIQNWWKEKNDVVVLTLLFYAYALQQSIQIKSALYIYLYKCVSHISASQLIYFNTKYCILLHINSREKMSLLYAYINVIIIWSILIFSGFGCKLLSNTLTQWRNVFLKHLSGNKGLCPWQLPYLCLDFIIFFIFLPIFHVTFQMLVLCFGTSKYY